MDMTDTQSVEIDVWAAVEGAASPEQWARLEGHPDRWRATLERLLDETRETLESVRGLEGPEREQIVADFEAEVGRLEYAYEQLRVAADGSAAGLAGDPPGEARLQVSWAGGQLVVWAAGPSASAATNDELADLLEAIGGPALGWSPHSDVSLADGATADAVAIPVEKALGWLVHVGGHDDAPGLGASVRWMGRVAIEAVRTVATGRLVPTVRSAQRRENAEVELSVRWAAALLDGTDVDRLANAMPAPVAALGVTDARTVTLEIVGAVVDAIGHEAASQVDLPAPPPSTRTPAAVAEAVTTRLDGSSFMAPTAAASEVSGRMARWAEAVRGPARSRLAVVLDPPDSGNAWLLSVLGPGADGRALPVELALSDSRNTAPLASQLVRLERLLPELLRAGASRRGQAYLSQDEAWELMTVRGPDLIVAGFEVRVPSLSRRKARPSLRLFTEPVDAAVVGVHQLSNVRWSAVFGDVELTAADVAKLAAEARPLVRSHGRWVELDHTDLQEAAAALAERAAVTTLTGAEILRYSLGFEGTLLGGLRVEGDGWATDLLDRAGKVASDPPTRPAGFYGELRSYQAEALEWLRFLDDMDLGGCLALDMGLGKTPTVLAHLARVRTRGRALVIAPPAVVGNWAAEAERFAPDLQVVIHHGASRATADELEAEVADADVVITTYGTAVRDIDALVARSWSRLILDEAQAIKNPASEAAQQLRRIGADTRIALTGTPIENGLGDLWAILDFTNPGLVGSRPQFVSQLQGEGEAALRALNGILVFRRTKTEPAIAAELPDRIDELDHCLMTPEQIGLYQAVLDGLVASTADAGGEPKQGAVLAAITALKQICNHPANYHDDDRRPLGGRSGKLARLEEIVESVFASGERILIFTHFATWGVRLAAHLTELTGVSIACYHGGLARGPRDKLVEAFQQGEGPGALVLSLKAGGTGLNLTAASHVVLYDRWWNPAVEDQARDRAWRIGQTRTVVSHRLVCPGTVDERVEEVVADKRHIADLILPKSSSLSDLNAEQLRTALGLRTDTLLTTDQL